MDLAYSHAFWCFSIAMPLRSQLTRQQKKGEQQHAARPDRPLRSYGNVRSLFFTGTEKL